MALPFNSSRKARRIWLRQSADRPLQQPPVMSRQKAAKLYAVDMDPVGVPFLPEFTQHAGLRQAQRNLSSQDLDMVLLYGETLSCAGAVFFHLRRKDVTCDDTAQLRAERLVGVTVVLDPTQQWVVTVYRNRRRGLWRLKRKPRRNMRPVK